MNFIYNHLYTINLLYILIYLFFSSMKNILSLIIIYSLSFTYQASIKNRILTSNSTTTLKNHTFKTIPSIYVGKISSSRSQIPYLFYDVGYCKNINPQYRKDTIGELLTGDRYALSPFEIKEIDIKKNGSDYNPQQACPMSLSKKDIEKYKEYINEEYNLSFYIDLLPIGLSDKSNIGNPSYRIGIPIGFTSKGRFFIYNFFKFTLFYSKSDHILKTIIGNDEEQYEIVAGSVFPSAYSKENKQNQYNNEDFVELTTENDEEYLKFDMYYSIEYRETNIKYSSRWDFIIHSEGDDIHWRPIIISLILISLCSLWVFIIFMRSVGQDIEKYNLQIVAGDLISTEKNWKQLCYDVFRTPTRKVLLCSIVGNGIQIGLMVFITLILGCLGFISPEKRGYLINTLLISSILFNIVSGYFSMRFYKLMKGENWLFNLIATALLFPIAIFITCCLCFIGFRIEGSSVSK